MHTRSPPSRARAENRKQSRATHVLLAGAWLSWVGRGEKGRRKLREQQEGGETCTCSVQCTVTHLPPTLRACEEEGSSAGWAQRTAHCPVRDSACQPSPPPRTIVLLSPKSQAAGPGSEARGGVPTAVGTQGQAHPPWRTMPSLSRLSQRHARQEQQPQAVNRCQSTVLPGENPGPD